MSGRPKKGFHPLKIQSQIHLQKMWSSPILLSLSTIFALLGFSLVLLAAFSDQWLEYQVGIGIFAIILFHRNIQIECEYLN